MRTLVLLCLILVSIPVFAADDLDKLAGKWTVKKINDQGESYTQTLEFKKNKFTFTIAGADGKVRLYAKGDVKTEKAGGFSILKFSGIKAGESESETSEINDDRAVVYRLTDDDMLAVASNFDKDRDQKPALDLYAKKGK